MAEVCIFGFHHEVEKGFLKFSGVPFPLKLYVGRILDLDLKHAAGVFEGLYDLVSDIVVASATMPRLLEDNHPIFSRQVDRLLNRQPSQDLLIDVDNLVILENLSSTEHSGLDLGRSRLKLKSPILHRVLLHQGVKHPLDALHAVSWRQLGLHQGFSHAGALADVVGYTIYDGKLRWEVQKVIAHLDNKKWLTKI